jgi:hypothetical protein
MQCILCIPHLIPPRELGDSLWRTVDAPQLKALLAKADWSISEQTDHAALSCTLFGVARQQDWPLAPLLAHHANLDAGSGYWLCATPVHLAAQRNALVLTDPATLAMSAAESAALTATLAAHLRDENITLHAPQAERWYLRCDQPPSMTTTTLSAATGSDVRLLLPQGPDSARWHRILTEMQMLLHAHPVNEARESGGRLPVNSVWLWGGGTLPTPPCARAPFSDVWSDDVSLRALAHYQGCRCAAAPDCIIPDALGKVQGETHLFSYEALETLMREGDVQAWSNAVCVLNRDWFVPLMHALQSRQLGSLTLISANRSGTQQFVMRRGDSLKLWRKNKYLQ